ncbi:hypothetical protein REPUB_Repub16aG0076500 [Reevesia pubescens]
MNFVKKKKVVTADNNGGFLEHKRKKTWEDAKSGQKCFMLYASDENIEVAKLSHVCRLDVRGKFKISDLSPGTVYEVVYEVKLTKGAFGWEFPIKLRLSLPNGRVQERQVSLLQKPRGQWMELHVGSFCTEENGETSAQEETREVCFDLYNHEEPWKHGLVIRGAILRPKS